MATSYQTCPVGWLLQRHFCSAAITSRVTRCDISIAIRAKSSSLGWSTLAVGLTRLAPCRRPTTQARCAEYGPAVRQPANELPATSHAPVLGGYGQFSARKLSCLYAASRASQDLQRCRRYYQSRRGRGQQLRPSNHRSTRWRCGNLLLAFGYCENFGLDPPSHGRR